MKVPPANCTRGAWTNTDVSATAIRTLNFVQVSCGSRDAQTLALVEGGMVYSWGDGDFGKLGRGGSEGCHTPALVDRLSGLGVCHVECGAQFSVALTCHGHVRFVENLT